MITIELKLHIKGSTKVKVREQSTSVKFKMFTDSDGFIKPEKILEELNKYSDRILQATLSIEYPKTFEGSKIPDLIRDSYGFNITVTPRDNDWKDTLIFEVTSENNNPYQGGEPSMAFYN
jgi:hypothetical protein